MPRHLWIQSDNTTVQAKTEKTFQILTWMIGKGKFDSISLNFLPVGHTHEDIDQLFALMCGVMCRERVWENPDEVEQVIKKGLAGHVAKQKEEFKVESIASIHPYNTFLPRAGLESALSFTFKLGMDLAAAEMNMLPKPPGARSVYCCVKEAMHHLQLNGPPVLYVTPERLGWVGNLSSKIILRV